MASEYRRYDVVWSFAATVDFESVIDFISLQNPERAKEILKKLKKHVATLSRHPERGRLVPETMAIGVDIYRELILAPYRVIYRIRSKQVFIMGLFDGRRDLQDLLFERLSRI